jgi:hypothetical protein
VTKQVDCASKKKKPKMEKRESLGKDVPKKKPKAVKIKAEKTAEIQLITEPEEIDWKVLWSQLKREGWTVIKAGKINKLHDWYYVRPWVDPASENATLGVDYFLDPEDVCNFVNGSGTKDGVGETTTSLSKELSSENHWSLTMTNAKPTKSPR